MLTRALASRLSPGGREGALSILIFHRVLPRPDPLFPEEFDARRFDALLRWLGKTFTVLRLDQAIGQLASGSLPPRALAITFDDGYADNCTVALPILERYEMSATFFVAAGFLEGGRMFNDTIIEAIRAFSGDELDLASLGLGRFATRTLADKRNTIDRLLPVVKYLAPDLRLRTVDGVRAIVGSSLPDDLMMTFRQLRDLHAAGMSIGGHTHSHPILSCLDDDTAFEEISSGKAAIESMIGEPISLFAYPNGKPGKDFSARHARMVQRAGFTAAVSTAPGAARRNTDLYQLPRFTPWDRMHLRFGLRLVNNLTYREKAAS